MAHSRPPFPPPTGSSNADQDWNDYFRLVEHSPEGIGVHDGHVVVYINPTGAQLLGASYPAEIIGRPWLDFVHPDSVPTARERMQRMLKGTQAVPAILERFVKLDGTVVDVEVVAASTRFGGKPAVQLNFRDNTERLKSAADLQLAYERLKELDRLKQDFLNSVSHELRTPLTSIKGYTEFLQDEVGGKLLSEHHGFVAQIAVGTERLERLVDDLLDYARMEAGSFKLDVRSSCLTDKVREIAASMRPQAVASQVGLGVEIPRDPVHVLMDPDRVGQILLNLLGNAIKFTPEGGRIGVRLKQEDGMVRVEVWDTGIGIKEADQDRLFDRFFQVHSSLTRERGGTGLGLSITKSLVEAHGGQIGVESIIGQGSTFWFTLPLSARG
jgi:PAS domain S-box-containing protein